MTWPIEERPSQRGADRDPPPSVEGTVPAPAAPRLVVPLAIGIGLRLLLAFVNREANDDHVAVVSKILATGSLPPLEACFSCYHAKLYHVVCAALAGLLGVRSRGPLTVLSQLVSVAAGTGTLLVLRRFLRDRARAGESPDAAWAGVWGFTLLALAPDIVAIDAQATNDSLVIFFSTLALWALWRFLRDGSRRHAAACAGAASLAAVTKASGLVTFGVCVSAIAVQWSARALLREEPAAAGHAGSRDPIGASHPLVHALALAMLVASGVCFVPFAGPYFAHWKRFGTPFVLNVPKDPPAPLLQEAPIPRAGVTSVANSYLTFRFLDLVAHPSIRNGKDPVPFHRTSLWTQLYGRFHFSRFAEWPAGWVTRNPRLLDLGRAIFVLALLPTSLAAIGFARSSRPWLDAARGRVATLARGADWVFPLAASAFTAMLLKLTWDYRSFATMKAIYLLPGLLAGLAFFTEGTEWAIARSDRARTVLACWLGTLASLYALDLLLLAKQLFRIL